jgi:hypothetical protein
MRNLLDAGEKVIVVERITPSSIPLEVNEPPRKSAVRLEPATTPRVSFCAMAGGCTHEAAARIAIAAVAAGSAFRIYHNTHVKRSRIRTKQEGLERRAA